MKGHNACGDGTTSTIAITVNPLPVPAGAITGNNTVCKGQNAVIYKVPTINNATSYIWTLPTGATGSSSVDSIIVNYGTSAVNGNITVKGHNACGDGTTSIRYITVVPMPNVNAGNDTAICPNSTITLAATGGNSYIWDNGVTQGVPFIPTTTETYTVIASNGFCTAADSIKVTVATTPPTPIIYQAGNALYSTAPSGNQWYNDFGIIVGSVATSYTPTTTGHYYVILSDTLGFLSDTSNILFVVVTGIENTAIGAGDVAIYPNPTNGSIFIELPVSFKNGTTTFEIYSVDGKLLNRITANAKKTQIDISGLCDGIYFVKILNSNVIVIRKILKG